MIGYWIEMLDTKPFVVKKPLNTLERRLMGEMVKKKMNELLGQLHLLQSEQLSLEETRIFLDEAANMITRLVNDLLVLNNFLQEKRLLIKI